MEANARNDRIAVVGAGLMGHGIAQAFAQKGFRVVLYDLSAEILQKALRNVEANLTTFVALGLEKESAVTEILSRIDRTTELKDAVSGADFVTEAAPEDLELKRRLLKEIDRHAPDHAVLSSNTSMLPISQFGSDVRRKDRLIITHWFNPPHIVPVVEIVRAHETSDETFQHTVHLLEKIGKQPVRVMKEIPGFLVNRIQAAMFREVLSLLEHGVASVADLDRAVKGSFGLRLGVIGVLETMDMAGLDLMYKGTAHLYKFIESSIEAQDVLRAKVERGELGLKTGKGFYTYTAGTEDDAELKKMQRDVKLLSLLKALGALS
jgi:3-hydroxybutyryl-CoA dehydrogenase